VSGGAHSCRERVFGCSRRHPAHRWLYRRGYWRRTGSHGIVPADVGLRICHVESHPRKLATAVGLWILGRRIGRRSSRRDLPHLARPPGGWLLLLAGGALVAYAIITR